MSRGMGGMSRSAPSLSTGSGYARSGPGVVVAPRFGFGLGYPSYGYGGYGVSAFPSSVFTFLVFGIFAYIAFQSFTASKCARV